MLAAAMACLPVSAQGEAETFGPADAPEGTAVAAMAAQVVPVGQAVGIKLFSDGVLVVGLACVETDHGSVSPGEQGGLRTGDVITHIDGTEVDSVEEVRQILTQGEGDALTCQVSRGTQRLQLTAEPAKSTDGAWQLGVWLRDSMAGIGTVTFYDPQSGAFAALGHGINDVDTAQLMPMETGSIMPASVSDVKRGASGDPGELHGTFDVEHDLGTLLANTPQGIYGVLKDSASLAGQQAVDVATRDQVQAGPAVIRANVDGTAVEDYEVEILQVYPHKEGETRELMLKVTDPRLLDTTGGIVQGMSGSPILQNGRLVGAVTHVLINDPTRGYGILAETMLEQARATLGE